MTKKKDDSELLKNFVKQRDGAFKRFPLLFTLLGAFGLSATFYGIQHIIEKSSLLTSNPYITLCVGLSVLFVTGTLYKKLG